MSYDNVTRRFGNSVTDIVLALDAEVVAKVEESLGQADRDAE